MRPLSEAKGEVNRIHGLAVNHETLRAHLARRLDDPRETLGAVVTTRGDQPHAITVPLNAEAIAVVLHFMEPVRP